MFTSIQLVKFQKRAVTTISNKIVLYSTPSRAMLEVI